MTLCAVFPGCMLWVPVALAGSAWAAYRFFPLPLQGLYTLGLAALAFQPLHEWPGFMDSW